MSADVITLLVAVVGMIGTLAAPVLAERITSRTKKQDAEIERQRQKDERAEIRQGKALEQRRASYAGLNASGRQYVQELRAYLRTVADGAVTDEARAALKRARQEWRGLYSDAQMILPDKVLDAAVTVNEALGDAYGMAKRVEAATKHPVGGRRSGETVETAQELCRTTLYELLDHLRRVMREDLGITESS